MIYQENPDFREQLSSGRYIYVDGHVCINDSRYVRVTPQELRLTPWANAHVDQCCLRFINIYEPCGVADYRFGAMNSDEEYNRHYMAFAQSSDTASLKEKMDAVNRTINELPQSFSDALCYVMKRSRVTIEALAEKSGISTRTISRLRNEERREYSLDQVIAICVALHLPPWLSRKMIEKAGFLLRQTPQHLAYQMILDCMYMDTVDEVQQQLVLAGCKKLRLNDNE